MKKLKNVPTWLLRASSPLGVRAPPMRYMWRRSRRRPFDSKEHIGKSFSTTSFTNGAASGVRGSIDKTSISAMLALINSGSVERVFLMKSSLSPYFAEKLLSQMSITGTE